MRIDQEPDVHPVFPPNPVVQIKALACQLPHDSGIPLSRFSTNDIVTEAIKQGIVAKISGSTVWRWLRHDAIKPWQYRSWIFPRDPQFEQKAGLVLDLYQGFWQGNALKTNEFVICADEKKKSIQARRRKHRSLPSIKNCCAKIEHEKGKTFICYVQPGREISKSAKKFINLCIDYSA